MNKRHLLLAITMVLMSVATAFAQAPLSFTYQAVVRNSNGRLISNSNVGVKISILQGSSTGTAVYTNNYTPRTNANGLFSIVIGDSLNSIGAIDWAAGPYFLKSEVDPNGGNNYTIVSSQQMLSVPYALHAHTVDNVIGGVNFIERQVLSISNDTVFLTGGSFVKLPAGFSGNYNDLTNKPTNVSAFTNDAGYLTSFTETQVLSIRHDTVFLTGGSFVKLPAGFSGNYNDLTNKPTIPTVPTNVSAFTNDAGYLTNATLTETQVLSIRHDTVFLTGGSFVKLPAGFSGNYNDLTNKPTIPTVPTNVSAFTNDAGYLTSATLTETQVLSKRGDTIFLTGGSFVVLPAETQNLSDVAANNDSVNSQIKNLYDPTDSLDAVNLRTLSTIIGRLDSIITYQNRVIDTLRQEASGNTAGDTAVIGLFNVGRGRFVRFSPGNLQWSATGGGSTPTTHSVAGGGTAAGTWRFAPHQWDTIGAANSNISSSYTGWIDLFGWATAGYRHGDDSYTAYYAPYSTSNSVYNSYYNYSGYGPASYSLVDTRANYDWGIYNSIYNPSTQTIDAPGTWRTLRRDEWYYLIFSRGNASGKYGMGVVNGVQGLILLPDNWTQPRDVAFISGDSRCINHYSTTQWSRMELAGAIFLPLSGFRNGTALSYNATYYWSTTLGSCVSGSVTGAGNAYALPLSEYGISGGFINSTGNSCEGSVSRYFGNPVRLVHDVTGN